MTAKYLWIGNCFESIYLIYSFTCQKYNPPAIFSSLLCSSLNVPVIFPFFPLSCLPTFSHPLQPEMFWAYILFFFPSRPELEEKIKTEQEMKNRRQTSCHTQQDEGTCRAQGRGKLRWKIRISHSEIITDRQTRTKSLCSVVFHAKSTRLCKSQRFNWIKEKQQGAVEGFRELIRLSHYKGLNMDVTFSHNFTLHSDVAFSNFTEDVRFKKVWMGSGCRRSWTTWHTWTRFNLSKPCTLSEDVVTSV